MSTAIDLTVGLNLEIGSVPVSLSVEVHTSSEGSVYTFDGCVQDAVIDIGSFISFVGQQFGVSVELPPELNLKAVIDYVAGQVIYTKPTTGPTTTELGASAKFDLIYQNGSTTENFTFTFYADTILTSGSNTSAYVVGGSVDTDLAFRNLPLLGSIPVFNEYTLKHLGFSYTNVDPSSNGGKPVTFNIPKVNTAANPLSTLTKDPGRMGKTYSIDSTGNQTTFNLNQKGFAFTAGLMREGSPTAEANFQLPMALPPSTPSNMPATYYQKQGTTLQTSPPASPIHWININKTFGPINLQQIGLNYAAGEATFGFSAGFSMGGFSLALQQLSITFPLPLPGMPAGDTVDFDLQGLAMDFKQGGLNIGGAFLKSVQQDNQGHDITNYFGEVIVQVGNYGFKAIGGYAPAQDGNPASFFIYANLEIPLGGPPFLYVSGLAFGFGVNYALNLPTIETLPGYLLLPGNAPQQPANAGDAFSGVLTQLATGAHPVITNEPGEYWVAAGLQFTSFNMVSAFVLVTFSFGVSFQVGIIGSATISLPEGVGSPLAYIEIDIVASLTPATGLLAVAGVISPSSYIFADFVKLSGGFAFYTWFSGAHKGDFVVSLGGYNSAFDKPDWYPTVPRVGISFALGPFQASGNGYLALTPAMFMAGMQVTASFTAGPIRAWFGAGFDFLISWAPFFYRADAYVNVGCSVNLGLFTISVSVGAQVNVWGPSFGGKAEVDLDFVSFTIAFGSAAPNPVPVTWVNIEQNFLPNSGSAPAPKARSAQQSKMMKAAATAPVTDASPTENVSASVSTGLLQKDVVDANGRTWNWIVNPNDFEIVTSTTIPANIANWSTGVGTTESIPNVVADYNASPVVATPIPYLELDSNTVTYSTTQVWNPDINVKPLGLQGVKSVHTITLLKADNAGDFTDYLSEVAIQPNLQSSPTALWGSPSATTDANTPSLLPSTLVGFNILPLPRNPDTVNNVPLIQLLFTQGNQVAFSYTSAQPDTAYTVSSQVEPPAYDLVVTVTGASTQTLPNRDYVLNMLTDGWVANQRASILDDLSANGFGTYTGSEVDLYAMATTEALTDWPLVGLLGSVLTPQ